MNCEQWERKILLADSGELSSRALVRLEKHLSVCSRCREYRNDAREILSTAGDSSAEVGPGVAVMTEIRRMARQEAATPGPVPFRLPQVHGRQALRPVAWALAAAAVLAILVSSRFMIPLTGRQGNISNVTVPSTGHQEDVAGVSAIIAMITDEHSQDESQDGQNDEVVESDDERPEPGREEAIQLLARQLLIMEGLAPDETSELELFNSQLELPPTALQSHSTDVSPQQKCV